MKFIVTGASGHLGANVVRALIATGETVRAVDVRPGAALAGLDVEFMKGDVLEPAMLESAFVGADFVLHLAARISTAGDPDGSVRRVNVDGVRNVAEAALRAGVRRVVHCSSLHAFDVGATRGPVRENSPRASAAALPAYDRSKAAGEDELRRVIDRGLDAVIVNPSGIVGPVDPEPSRLGRVLLAMFRGRMPIAVRGAFDWVDVRDVSAALLAAAERGRTGENYLLGGHRASVAELGRVAAEVAGRRPPRVVAPLAPCVPSRRSACNWPAPAGPAVCCSRPNHCMRWPPIRSSITRRRSRNSAIAPARWKRRCATCTLRSSPRGDSRPGAETRYRFESLAASIVRSMCFASGPPRYWP